MTLIWRARGPGHRSSFRRIGRLAVGAALGGAVAVVVLACSSAPAASQPPIAVSEAWVRPADAGGGSAAYLTIVNPGSTPDTLLSVSSPGAGSVMLHETKTDASGMTGMSMIDKLPIAAGATVTLQPGGYHLMIGGLTKALAAGGTLELRLVFEHAGTIVVQAAVRTA